MNMRFAAAVLALAVVPFAARAADSVDNPYKNVKVGDSASYKLSMKIGPLALDGTITQTVSAKDDKEATLKVTSKVNGQDVPAQEQKIDLTKPFDPAKAGNLPPGIKVTTEKGDAGEETIKVGGKEYKCKWESFKTKADFMGMMADMNMKIWQSKDFNMVIVKTEVTGTFNEQKIDLKTDLEDSGSKKE